MLLEFFLARSRSRRASASGGRGNGFLTQEPIENAVEEVAEIDRAGILIQRIQRPAASECAAHRARRDRASIFRYRSPASGRGRYSGTRLGRRSANRRRSLPARSSRACQPRYWLGPSIGSTMPSARRKASRRSSQRDGTLGLPPTRCARVITTRGAPKACWKSCAARPILRSSDGRPNFCRMGRLSQGSMATSPRPDTFVETAQHHADRPAAGALRVDPR